MLGLFYDLGEAIKAGSILEIQNLERYKTAYENKIKREMGDKTGKEE